MPANMLFSFFMIPTGFNSQNDVEQLKSKMAALKKQIMNDTESPVISSQDLDDESIPETPELLNNNVLLPDEEVWSIFI